MDIYEKSLRAHKKSKGKIAIVSKVNLETKEDLSTYYSPGVAGVSSYLAKNPKEAYKYTSINNSVAVVSDGSSVLGLGNIGPEGALPVMEGKAILFKKFANIDAFPIVLNTQDPEKIIETVLNIAPSFGGINLEDFSAPNCFRIEDELKKKLTIPVMHDDQHGTAVVVLAGLLNACKVTGRELRFARIVIIGAGAAGVAIAKLLHEYGQRLSSDGNGSGPMIFAVDSKGLIHRGRKNLNESKKRLLEFTNLSNNDCSVDLIVNGADIIIGVSGPGNITAKMVHDMAEDPIVFALANPEPEILPEDAKAAGAAIVATGRSDYPNQVNNVLAFPGLFRGALDTNSAITDDKKIMAAEAIANIVKNPSANEIIPSPLNPLVVDAVSAVFYNQKNK
ncbi:NADP-dependent malic enzyme [Candidatus Saccharibacteria bacterium]|jgi:malate dehydrogenase (oxaloacetate-decarboxylating)|nr:NADP-dependent malic enzyme [Candidatus Saccharibacteria bacterium]